MVSLEFSQKAAVNYGTELAAAGQPVPSLLLQGPVAPVRGVPEEALTTLFLRRVGIYPTHFSGARFFFAAGGRVLGAGGPVKATAEYRVPEVCGFTQCGMVPPSMGPCQIFFPA